MSREFRVEHPDGSTETLAHVSSEEEYKFGEQDLGVFTTRRDSANGVTLTEGEDEVYFVENGVDQWGGLLKDIVRKGAQTELVVDSFERYARDAKPTDGDNIYENVTDTTVVNDAITDTPGLTAGTVANVESGLSFVFSHSSQAKKMRRVEASGSGELMFNVDKTVDYVDSLGSDKTATTLSPSNQNVIGDIEVSRKGGSQKVTHLRMLGAGEGSAQVSTEVSVTNAPTNPADQVWDTYRDKGLTAESALQSLGETLIAEMNTEHVNAEAAIRGVDVQLGDEFTVSVPDENLNRAMRVIELKTVVDKEGRRHMATLSTRQKTEASQESKRRQDVENYNVAFEGSPVTMTAGGGRQPVDGTHDYEFDFYYPAEVEYEHRVKMFIKGLQYRAYSQGAASGGDHSHTVDVFHPSHSHDYNRFGELEHAHTFNSAGELQHSHVFNANNELQHGHVYNANQELQHGHFVDLQSTEANEPHGVANQRGDGISFVDDTSGWEQVESISVSGYELGFVHVHASSSENVLECRARDSSAVGVNDTTPDDKFSPSSGGTAVVGSSSGHDHSNTNNDSDGDGYSSSVTLAIPEDWGFVDVDVRASSGAVNTNVHVAWLFIGDHTHNITGITSDPELGTQETTETELGTQETTDTQLGAQETTDTQLGAQETSETALGTTSSESSDASGPHTHPVDPGIIDTQDYPSNCDVVVNGQALGVSLGDGSGPFEQEVDLAGQLNPGQVNTIRINSDSLGHVQAHLDIDVYRQILGNG